MSFPPEMISAIYAIPPYLSHSLESGLYIRVGVNNNNGGT